MENHGFIDIEIDSEASKKVRGEEFKKEKEVTWVSLPEVYVNGSKTVDDGRNYVLDTDIIAFKAKKFPQLLAAFAALIGAFSFGNVLAYSAVSMPKLRLDAGFPHPTEDEISWMSSMITLGAFTACWPAGLAVDIFGRRKTLLMLTLPFISGWLLIHFSKSVVMLMIGRFITGFCGGAITLAAPIFIAETSQPDIRGMLNNGFDLMACIGFVFMNLIGKFFPWRTQALICAFIPLLSHAILFFVSESPRFLLSKGKEDEALKSLCWFRGAPPSSGQCVKSEFYSLIDNIEQSRKDNLAGWRSKWEEFTKIPVLKCILVIFLLFFFREFSGVLPIDFYTVDIFRSAGSTVDAYTASIIVYSVSTVFSTGSALLVDRIGRKILMFVSETLMTLSLCSLGTFFYVKEQHSISNSNSSSQDWISKHPNLGILPLVSLVTFIVGYVIGMGPISLSIMPELLPQKIRGVASSFLLMIKWIMSFVVARYFKNYLEIVGNSGGYWTFSIICFFAVLFVIFFLPETKCKSLEQIQMEMNGNKSKSKSNLKSESKTQAQETSEKSESGPAEIENKTV